MLASVDRHWRERLQESSLLVEPLAGTANDSLEAFWKMAVANFTRCTLTNPADRLIAIWGIAALVRDALGEDFGAGLWDKNLHEQLAWRVVDCGSADRPELLRDMFPSWSWASVIGKVEVADRVAGPRFYKVADHERREISFQLKTNLFRRQDEETADSWAQEMPRMDEQIARMRARGLNMLEVDKNAEWSGKSAKTLEAPGKRKKAAPGACKTKGGEELPELQDPSIPIRGHILDGTLTSDDNGRWTLLVPGPTEGVLAEAFPDCKPQCDGLNCKFVFLAVTREFLDTLGRIMPMEEDAIEDEDLERCLYSGVGILVESSGGPGQFRRTGAWIFRSVPHGVWSTWLKICCGRDAGDEHDLNEGTEFFLS